MNSKEDLHDRSAIAIIGMSGRFPGAKDLDEFWQNLWSGVESITFFSDEELETAGIPQTLLHDPSYVKARGVLSEVEMFDAGFFGFNPREAEVMDPQHRLFLECAWQVLESAGYDPETFEGRIGVYGGVAASTYARFNLASNPTLAASVDAFQAGLATDKDFLSTRVSYKLNLKGPSLSVQTACSTGLVALHLACQSLLYGECDMALAGSAAIAVPQEAGYLYRKGMIASPDGHCRAFDAKAQGIVSGSGVGVVLLKRLAEALSDGDSIRAIVLGSAINNDGSAKVGFTAPSVEGQAEVIAEALTMAGIEPEAISYIEAHGTGTPLGDPVEIAALTQVFRARTMKRGFCAVGSVKTNVGHLDTAAGIVGLIKTVLALEQKKIPPSLHFEQANPELGLESSPFFVNTIPLEWRTEKAPRRAGVSSFGIGGTNVHVVLEEAPVIEPSGGSRPRQLLVLSAKTNSALRNATSALIEYLKLHPDSNLADVAYTLQVGRRPFSYRQIVVCQGLSDAVTALETLDPERVFARFQEPVSHLVTFMFPGQGAQYVNMGLELFQGERAFREQIDRCSELLRPHLGLDLREALYPEEGANEATVKRLEQTWITQPALFVVEYALARLWMAWGVHPHAMIGHSIGEYVAACLSGVFSLEDALMLVAARGRLMQKLPVGAMLAVSLPEDELQAQLNDSVSLAASNGPSLCVVSGPTDAIEALRDRLTRQGVPCRRLHTSHAFHSAMMDPVLEPFAQQVRKVTLQPPQIPYISNVSGAWATVAEATDPDYWARQLRQTVFFGRGLSALRQEPNRIFLEVGPGQTLSTCLRQLGTRSEERVALTSLPHPGAPRAADEFLLTTLGHLWMAGVPVNWAGFYSCEQRHRVSLPTYPFERQRYWIEPRALSQSNPQHASAEAPLDKDESIPSDLALHRRPDLTNAYVAPRNELEKTIAAIWQELLGIEQVGVYDGFYDLGGHSLLATQVISRLQEAFPVELPVRELFESLNIARMAQVIERTLVEQVQKLSSEEIRHLV